MTALNRELIVRNLSWRMNESVKRVMEKVASVKLSVILHIELGLQSRVEALNLGEQCDQCVLYSGLLGSTNYFPKNFNSSDTHTLAVGSKYLSK